jgi:dihydropteroate synthase
VNRMQGSGNEPQQKIWKIKNQTLRFGRRPLIMGILNVTPDSFYDGGRHYSHEQAVEHGLRLAGEGADILDVGGLSTRPGSSPIAWEEEAERVVPVISKLVANVSIPISVDTYRASVAEAALHAGARIVNDVGALRMDSRMASVVADSQAGLVLMHMRGEPSTMQMNTGYDALLEEILLYLQAQMKEADAAGIHAVQVIVDPGIGFGKNAEQNLEILKNLEFLRALNRPILVGPSRKSFIGRVLGRGEEERLAGTLACVDTAFRKKAEVIRVHDVKETLDFLNMLEVLENKDDKGLSSI